MASLPILSILILIPIIGSIILVLIPGNDDSIIQRVKFAALWISLVNALLSLSIFIYFDPNINGLQLTEQYDWLVDPEISYRVGIDGLSIFFVILNNLLLPICILAGWNSVKQLTRPYLISFFILTSALNGVFIAQDLVLFYFFFEAVLIPMFIIIGVWGGPRRVYATFKFFLFTLLGSVLMLLAIIVMIGQSGSADISFLNFYEFSPSLQIYLFLAFFAAFAVKIPMWPLHTWLPDAHVEAPTAGSVILAALLLKMGGYGLIRINLPMFPEASAIFGPFILILSAIAVIYASLVALAQTDMKKLIAYSSVAHMGFVTAGIFTMNEYGLQGAVLQMLSHGVVSAALFLIVGIVYERVNSRDISRFQGLVEVMPKYAVLFLVFLFSSIALPGTSGFVGEILVIIAAMQTSSWIALLLATSMVLGAVFMLYLYRRVIFGVINDASLESLKDLSVREICIFTPLVILVFLIGLYPAFFLDYIHPSIFNLLTVSK